MKQLFCIILLMMGVVHAENKEVEKTPESCRKVKGMSTQAAEVLSQTLKVSAQSITFVRGEYLNSAYNLCVVVVDTPKGIKRCGYMWILDSGKGRTFAASPTSGYYPSCE